MNDGRYSVLRTWLFGPGADSAVHEDMSASGASVLIQDLEDFTPPLRRNEARALAAGLFARWRAVGARVCVRINPLHEEGLLDLSHVVPAKPDFVAYPKASTASDMLELDRAIASTEVQVGLAPGSIGILPVCETALGVVNVREIAAASPRIRYALLGAEDLAADLMAERSREAVELDHARRRFVLECRAAGIEPIDAPYTFTDTEGAAQETRYARRLGYRAKSLVRPDHVSAVLAALIPSEAEKAQAQQMVEAFEAARARGEERALVDGLWVEVPTYLNAKRLLAQQGMEGGRTLSMHMFVAATFVSLLIVQSAAAHTLSAERATNETDFPCVNDPSWTAPQKPFRVYGNTWHVGPRGLGIFLITAPTGHVLIDGGIPGNAPLIEANIRSLGINLHDIKWILNSHAHCDHAGGIAQLARSTGAQVIASAADARSLARGGRNDPQYGNSFPFSPVRVARPVIDGESLRLGDLVLTAHATPGHTKGNTTWTWKSCEDTRCLHMVHVGSLSAPDYKLIGNPKYPDIAKDFQYSFAMVAALPCEIALAPHPGMVNFWERVAKRNQGDADALIDPTVCRAYAKDARESFERELTKQRRDAAAAAR